MKNRYMLCALALSAMCALLLAQETSPRPSDEKVKKLKEAVPKKTTFDELSQKLFDQWRKIEYRWEGVKKARAVITATVTSMGQSASTEGVYTYDGKASDLKYNPGPAGAALSQQGWDKDMFDSMRTETWTKNLAGGALTAEATDTGAKVMVTGKTKAPFRAYYFNKDGVLVRGDMEITQHGATMKGKFEPTYQKLASGKYLMTGYLIEMEIPNVGKYREKTTMTYKEQDGVQALVKSESNAQMGASPMSKTKDIKIVWTFNDNVK